jgi:hypothetical protein
MTRQPQLPESLWWAFLAETFQAAGLAHALIGGMAYNAWCAIRQTDHYDFVVLAKRGAIAAVLATFAERGLTPRRVQDRGGSSGPDFATRPSLPPARGGCSCTPVRLMSASAPGRQRRLPH